MCVPPDEWEYRETYILFYLIYAQQTQLMKIILRYFLKTFFWIVYTTYHTILLLHLGIMYIGADRLSRIFKYKIHRFK